MGFDLGSLGDFFSSLFGGGGDAAAPAASVAPDASVGFGDIPSTEIPSLSVGSSGLGALSDANIAGANDAFSGFSPSALGSQPGASQGTSLAGAQLDTGGIPDARPDNSELNKTLTSAQGAVDQGRTTNPLDPVPKNQLQQPPTAWESIQQAPGKWWSSVSNNAANEFNRAPIATSLKVAAPLAAVGLSAANALSQPGIPKYIKNPPGAPAQPTPLDTTPPDPMSPLLRQQPQGGFNVGRSSSGL